MMKQKQTRPFADSPGNGPDPFLLFYLSCTFISHLFFSFCPGPSPHPRSLHSSPVPCLIPLSPVPAHPVSAPQDMFLMAAMGPPGGGRTAISPRLQGRFNIINMTFPTVRAQWGWRRRGRGGVGRGRGAGQGAVRGKTDHVPEN